MRAFLWATSGSLMTESKRRRRSEIGWGEEEGPGLARSVERESDVFGEGCTVHAYD